MFLLLDIGKILNEKVENAFDVRQSKMNKCNTQTSTQTRTHTQTYTSAFANWMVIEKKLFKRSSGMPEQVRSQILQVLSRREFPLTYATIRHRQMRTSNPEHKRASTYEKFYKQQHALPRIMMRDLWLRTHCSSAVGSLLGFKAGRQAAGSILTTVKYWPNGQTVRGTGPGWWPVFWEVHHFLAVLCRNFPKTQCKAIALSQRRIKAFTKQEPLVQVEFHDFFFNMLRGTDLVCLSQKLSACTQKLNLVTVHLRF